MIRLMNSIWFADSCLPSRNDVNACFGWTGARGAHLTLTDVRRSSFHHLRSGLPKLDITLREGHATNFSNHPVANA